MCGIVGYLDKRGDLSAPVGQVILAMLSALGRRGPDSAGAALYGEPGGGHLVVRVKLGEAGELADRAGACLTAAREVAAVKESSSIGPILRLVLTGVEEPRAVERALEAVHPEIEVVSLGRRLEVMKQVGSPENLEATFGLSGFRGTHGIGHTRLSTESRVDLSHSQPFWAHGFPDLAVVHNGHITNYHKLRRRYEQRGVRFYTENDSEVIGIYLADRMRRGESFEVALQASLEDLDGSFCFLAATAEAIGYAKDPFCLKPLMLAEAEAFVALATEEVALRAAFPGPLRVREPGNRQAQVFALPGPKGRRRAA